MPKKTVTLYYPNGEKNAGAHSRTLVSALIGATSKRDIRKQLQKLEAISNLKGSEQPDIISDLSLQHSDSSLYSQIIKSFPDFIISTLPIYRCKPKDGSIDKNELLQILISQIEAGVGLITIHPTPNQKLIKLAQNRLCPWTSRGGSMVIRDHVQKRFKGINIYLEIIDDIIAIAKKQKVVISIGASFRSANIFDSLDECQIEEFRIQKEIADYISERGVHAIIEGPGHSSPQKIELIAAHYSKMDYPIMPLGPIPTDAAIGQDHISSSIGGVLLGIKNCADILTSVTREEHTGGIPSTESTIEAIKATRIAAHIIDMNKIDDLSKDATIAEYRAQHQTCIYGKRNSGCSRCAEVCPLLVNEDYFN